MATTPLRKNGVARSKLTDKRWRFVMEYVIDSNGTRAAIAAGYSKGRADVTACELLKDYNVKAMIGKLMGEQAVKFEVQRDEILMHLVSCCTRDGKDFVDEDGHLLINNINDLPDAVTNAIDGIKERKRVYTDKDGGVEVTYEYELKLVSKAAALRMAMEHKGLFAATLTEHRVQFPWDQLQGPPDAHDPIEAKILDVESKAIEGNGHSSNGNGKANSNGNGKKP